MKCLPPTRCNISSINRNSHWGNPAGGEGGERGRIAETLAEKAEHLARVGADGTLAGAFGGRPRKAPEDSRGVPGGDKSNRLARGLKRRRQDVEAFDGLAMCKWMVEKARECTDMVDMQRAACRRYEEPWRKLKLIYDKGLEFWKQKVKSLNVGGGKRSLNKQGQNLNLSSRPGGMTSQGGLSKGCRAVGGGRKDNFKTYKQQLKTWVEEERRNGHSLDTTDLHLQFVWFLSEMVKALEQKAQAAEGLNANLQAHLHVARVRLQRLKGAAYTKKHKSQLMHFCCVRLQKPQRQLKLTLQEEADRCRLTWQMFDRTAGSKKLAYEFHMIFHGVP